MPLSNELLRGAMESAEEIPVADMATARPAGLPAFDDRFEVIERIARTPNASVWTAHQRQLDRVVAVKILDPITGSAPTEVRERFMQEAVVLARLRNPNVVSVFDFGETRAGQPFIVMEYLSGRLLSSYIEGPPLDERRVFAISFQIAGALTALHHSGLVHMDLKPSNIVVLDATHDTQAGSIKLLDFGITEPAGGEPGFIGRGTPMFMAPERFHGAAADRRADVYSFGILLYMLVTGEAPFRGETTEDLADLHLNAAVPSMAGVGHARGAAAPLEAIVHRCLSKDPNDRFGSIDELLRELRACFFVLFPQPGSNRPSRDLYSGPPANPAPVASIESLSPGAAPPKELFIAQASAPTHPRRWLLIAPLLLVVLAVGVWLASRAVVTVDPVLQAQPSPRPITPARPTAPDPSQPRGPEPVDPTPETVVAAEPDVELEEPVEVRDPVRRRSRSERRKRRTTRPKTERLRTAPRPRRAAPASVEVESPPPIVPAASDVVLPEPEVPYLDDEDQPMVD